MKNRAVSMLLGLLIGVLLTWAAPIGGSPAPEEAEPLSIVCVCVFPGAGADDVPYGDEDEGSPEDWPQVAQGSR